MITKSSPVVPANLVTHTGALIHISVQLKQFLSHSTVDITSAKCGRKSMFKKNRASTLIKLREELILRERGLQNRNISEDVVIYAVSKTQQLLFQHLCFAVNFLKQLCSALQ